MDRRSESEVSKIEQRTDCYVSTLRNYIQAMGGELDILAKFLDRSVKVSRFSDFKTPDLVQSGPSGRAR